MPATTQDDTRTLVVLLASWLLSPLLCWLAIRLDERRLDETRIAKAWNPASRTSAVLLFGPLAVVLHFARTRGSFRDLEGFGRKIGGLLLGVAAAVLALGAASLVVSALAWALGVDE